ncbi:response regulator transcription factor [Paenibacillus sp. sgz500958]|uniref:response regulator transcription factor n=1 Tax=Paenibacillus sp. sgz500958 TaxID=3242475 RepID=UPI0036D360CD
MVEVWQVVLVGCHPTSMLGAKLILEEEGELSVSSMCTTWSECIEIVKEEQPELVLMDYRMPEGDVESILMDLKKSVPSTHFVIMTDDDAVELLQPLLGLGASGLLSKRSSPSQLLQLIKGLREGYLSLPLDWVSKGLLPVSSAQAYEGILLLTPTESFIMDRIVQGITYDKIAQEIEVSRRSIDNYLRKIYVKLNVTTRAQAIEKYALFSRQNKQRYA